MKKLVIWLFAPVVAIAMLVFGSVSPATALITIKLDDGTTFVTVNDGGGGDTCVAVGCVTFNGAIGNFIVNVSTGLTSLGGGPLTAPSLLDLNSVNVSTGTGGTIHISTSDIGFTGTGPIPLFSSWGGTISTHGIITQIDQCAGSSKFATNYGCVSLTPPNVVNPGAFLSTTGIVYPTASPWALSEIVTATFSGTGSMSWNFSSDTVVPEPMSLLLLGSGLVGAGLWGRKRLAKR